MTAFSFSSCSRAAMPAAERARTRWMSTNPTRLGALLFWAEDPVAPSHIPARSPDRNSALIDTMDVRLISLPTSPCSSDRLRLSRGLKGRPHGELEVPELLPRGRRLVRVQVDAVVHADGPEGR